MIDYRPAFVGNYREGRSRPVDTVIIHTTEATAASAIGWFGQDHKPYGVGPTSAHYVISRDGILTLCVKEEDTAFHAGNFGYNLRSIGIECEGYVSQENTWGWPLLDALLGLCAQLASKYGIPVDREHFIGHNEVPDPFNPKGRRGGVGHNEDPGPFFPWERFITSLTARTNSGDIT